MNFDEWSCHYILQVKHSQILNFSKIYASLWSLIWTYNMKMKISKYPVRDLQLSSGNQVIFIFEILWFEILFITKHMHVCFAIWHLNMFMFLASKSYLGYAYSRAFLRKFHRYCERFWPSKTIYSSQTQTSAQIKRHRNLKLKYCTIIVRHYEIIRLGNMFKICLDFWKILKVSWSNQYQIW